MKYFYIDKRIDQVLLKEFFDFCNQYSDDDWTIVIWSLGGIMNMGRTIVGIINSRAERCTVVCQNAYSAAFDIFYSSNCKKVIAGDAKGMVHRISSEFRVTVDSKPMYFEDEATVKAWKENKEMLAYTETLLTKEELKRYMKDDEIYFTRKRLKKIFPNAECI